MEVIFNLFVDLTRSSLAKFAFSRVHINMHFMSIFFHTELVFEIVAYFSSFIFCTDEYSIAWKYHKFFVQTPIDGHLVCL